jgi:hypothetical protein
MYVSLAQAYRHTEEKDKSLHNVDSLDAGSDGRQVSVTLSGTVSDLQSTEMNSKKVQMDLVLLLRSRARLSIAALLKLMYTLVQKPSSSD